MAALRCLTRQGLIGAFTPCVDAGAGVPGGDGGLGAPRRIVRQLAIPALRLGVAGGLCPRRRVAVVARWRKDESALHITDGRILILAVVGVLWDATRQARYQYKKENQVHK